MTLGSLFARLISCRGENGVHGGEPMTKYGCVDLINCLTRFCTSGKLKSQGRPVLGSFNVKSKLHPGLSDSPLTFWPPIS